MSIKVTRLVFRNVLGARFSCSAGELEPAVQDIRNAIIKKGLYITGPVFYTIAAATDQASDYTLYLPVSARMKFEDNDDTFFVEDWKSRPGLLARHANPDEDIQKTFELLRNCADAYQTRLIEPFYCILLPVFGETIIDVFAEAETLPQSPQEMKING